MARREDRRGFYIGRICSTQFADARRRSAVEIPAISKLKHSRQIGINNGEMAAFIVAAKIVSTAVEASCLSINEHRWRDIVGRNKRCLYSRSRALVLTYRQQSGYLDRSIARSLGTLFSSSGDANRLRDLTFFRLWRNGTRLRSRSHRWVGSSFLAASNWLYFVARYYIIPRGKPTFATCTWKLAVRRRRTRAASFRNRSREPKKPRRTGRVVRIATGSLDPLDLAGSGSSRCNEAKRSRRVNIDCFVLLSGGSRWISIINLHRDPRIPRWACLPSASLGINELWFSFSQQRPECVSQIYSGE